ncbi:MAG: preprotein translocase subunit SecA, partial [Dietzia sp.]
KRILEGEDITDQVESMIYQVVSAYVDGATAEGYVEDWDLDKLWDALRQLYPVTITAQEIIDGDEYGSPGDLSAKNLKDAVLDDVFARYDEREAEIEGIGGEGAMRQLERSVMLQVLDRKWREHLYEMDYLKEGIGLRAMAQRDPLVEYQREGYDMFAAMMDGVREETVAFLFNVKVQANQQQAAMAGPSAAQAAALAGANPILQAAGTGRDVSEDQMQFSGPSETGDAQLVDEGTGANRAERRSQERARRAERRERAARSASRGRRD